MPDNLPPNDEFATSGQHAQPSEPDDLTPVYEFNASKTRFGYAFRDLKQAVSKPRLLRTVIWKYFMSKYRRSMIGPFWITLSTLLSVTGLALLYGKVLGRSMYEYYPYVTSGIVTFGFISSVINGGVNAFGSGSKIFNEMPIAKSVFAFRALGSSLLNFLFKVPVIVGALIAVGRSPALLNVATSLLGIFLLLWTGFWLTLIIGTFGMRFKDTPQAVSSIMSALFFLTPVFWMRGRLGPYEFIVDINPVYHFLHLIRGPLLDDMSINGSLIWVSTCAGLSTVIGLITFGYFARRFSYWS